MGSSDFILVNYQLDLEGIFFKFLHIQTSFSYI